MAILKCSDSTLKDVKRIKAKRNKTATRKYTQTNIVDEAVELLKREESK